MSSQTCNEPEQKDNHNDGVSAASGIPTFRGPEGYWTVGSDVYQPEDMATRRSFKRFPAEVWRWYLYRRGVCRAARPNAAHHALAEMQQLLPDRMTLVTQNVDGLHSRAGSGGRGYVEIHGTLENMRCMPCGSRPAAIAPDLVMPKEGRLSEQQAAQLQCPVCGGWQRPHVLWFDESYDDDYFPLGRVLEVVGAASLVITAGTSGGTNLPWLVARAAKQAGAFVLDINPQPSPFVSQSQNALGLAKGAEEVMPQVLEWIK